MFFPGELRSALLIAIQSIHVKEQLLTSPKGMDMRQLARCLQHMDTDGNYLRQFNGPGEVFSRGPGL